MRRKISQQRQRHCGRATSHEGVDYAMGWCNLFVVAMMMVVVIMVVMEVMLT